MKTAIIIFAEAPVAGQVKTALTVDEGGIFTAEEVRDFYAACLLDVTDLCLAANCGDVFICGRGDRDCLAEVLAQKTAAPALAAILTDDSPSFGLAVERAVTAVREKSSAEQLLLLSGDLPALQSGTLQALLNKLAATKGPALAICPSQDGSCSLLALKRDTAIDLNAVFAGDDRQKPLGRLVDQAAHQEIPLYLGEIVPDVDTVVDLASIMPILNALTAARPYSETVDLPHRTLAFLQKMGMTSRAAPAPTDDCLDGYCPS